MDLQKVRDDAVSWSKVAAYLALTFAAFGMGWIAHGWWG